MVEILEYSGRDAEGFWSPIVVRCDCGRKAIGNGPGDDFTCRCGQIYNAFGQRVMMHWSDFVARYDY